MSAISIIANLAHGVKQVDGHGEIVWSRTIPSKVETRRNSPVILWTRFAFFNISHYAASVSPS